MPEEDLAGQLLRVTAEAAVLRERVAELEAELRDRKIECGTKHSLFKFPPEVQKLYTKLPPTTLRTMLSHMETVERARPDGGGSLALEIRRHPEDGDWRWAEFEPKLPAEQIVRAAGNRLTGKR